MTPCAVELCDRPALSRGWCEMHYKRWWRTGRLEPPTVAEQFWAKVDTSPGHGPWGDCHIWTASCFPNGYGQFRGRGAHVTAWELDNGPVPAGMIVRHTCDNKPCVRHLLLGTHADNMRDMVARRRQAAGERLHLARLTERDVRLIRTQASARSCASIARSFGVHESTIARVLRHETWKGVTP